MSRFRILCGIVAACVCIGCGSGKTVKQGDRFEVIEEIKASAVIASSQPYDDGFTCILTKGSILEATAESGSNNEYIPCIPVFYNGIADRKQIEEMIVPADFRTREGYQGFSFSLPKSLLGASLKRAAD